MGIPDESDGPVRKRPRLSLRSTIKPGKSKPIPETTSIETATDNTASQSSSMLVKTLDMSSECIDLTADLPSSPDPVVAPVASLHNLGNTCFLNSMLEVLRYTPGFLDGLRRLQEEILAAESKLYLENSDGDDSEERLNWQLVKNTYSMYQEMDKREEKHKEIATADASSMAVRPSGLLDNIRELNPMFEGHFQHDAQELLRCLLCYIEDAEKELLQLRDKEKVKFGKSPAVIDIEAKLVGQIIDVSGQVEIGLSERGTSSNSYVSLKGGDCKRKGKIISQERQRPHGLALEAILNTTVNHKINCSDSSSCICDMVKAENHSNISETDIHMMIKDGDHPLDIAEREELKTGILKLPILLDSGTRKRKRSSSRSTSGVNLADITDHVVKPTNIANTRGLRKKAAYVGTCDSSSIAGKCQETRGTFYHPSQVPVSNGPACGQSEDFLAGGSTHLSLYQNLQFAALSKCNSSSRSPARTSAAPAPGEDPSKPSIPSVLPSSHIKRLGMQGPIVLGPVSQVSLNTEHIDDNQAHEDDNDDNSSCGDVNNNSDGFNNSICWSSSVQNEKRMPTDLPKRFERQHEETSEYQGCSKGVFPLTVGKCARFSITPTKTEVMVSPVKSPILVKHSDEISMLLENDVLSVDSAINSVATKYFSFRSHREGTSISMSTPSSSALSSCMSCPSHRFSVSPINKYSSEVPSSVSSHIHVLKPNKEISVMVWPSPNKQLTQLMFSDNKSGHSDCKLSCDKDMLSLDNKSYCVVSSNDACLSGVLNKKEIDLLVRPSLILAGKFAQDDKKQFPEMLQMSNDLTLKATSPCDIIESRSVCAESYSPTSHAKLNLLRGASNLEMFLSLSSKEKADRQRSPGANIHGSVNDLHPKLELKKCDWLGVSPVRPISAKKAMLVLDRHRRALDSTYSVRRKILYGNSERSSSSHVKSDLPCHGGQIDKSENTFCSATEAGNEKEASNINNPPTIAFSKAAENKAILKSSQSSILNFAQKLPRRSQQVNKIDEPLSSKTDEIISKCNSVLSQKGISLKPVSVIIDNCDWVLQTLPGNTVSASQAIMDIKRGRRMTLKSKSSNTETLWLEKQSMVHSTDVSVSEIKPQASPGTLIEKLFGGIIMHQTKCLECETARQRQEVFMDISVPVRSVHGRNVGVSDFSEDEDDDKARDKSGALCLSKLIQAFSSVERLRDTNKYFCEHCVHYVEAERSCHYLGLPAVLTLHLKRFSANSRTFGGVSKLVDKVTIPQNLSCLRYQCKTHCSDSSHRYSLFAIVTHSGTSILHGHYRAYVKVQPQVNPSVFHNLLRSNVKGGDRHQHLQVKNNTSVGCFPNSKSCFGDRADNGKDVKHFDANRELEEVDVTCSDVSLNAWGNLSGEGKLQQGMSTSHDDRVPDVGCTEKTKSDLCGNGRHGSFWLECDDECVKVMDEEEFLEKLEEKDGCLIGTPYVLFYHKLAV